MVRGVVTMERVETFSAAHRLHSNQLSEEENQRVYGKCNNPNGHGHNYVWKVKLRGIPDPETGMVYDLAELKKDMKTVLDTVDHKNLDKDVEWFQVGVCIWRSVPKKSSLFLFLSNRTRRPQRDDDPSLFFENSIIKHAK
ncbi:6-pyruvoyl tetrahydropterin synthase/QueD family protein [Ancylostoma caninum]|uniref:6-pyruvoyl tetrahydrobiopterin synthase n=1 Tax=Ancylostoma caninum TaxID=29170 RepID=A0A368GKC5_ANCCA|nr:6-pyruvoyl tetrahydropterin synthase/QueD family protein [Ancylostoma caninum]